MTTFKEGHYGGFSLQAKIKNVSFLGFRWGIGWG